MPHADHVTRSRVVIAFAAVYLIWGSSYLANRMGVTVLPAFLFGGLRFVSAGAIMLLISGASGKRVAPSSPEWRHLAVLALFGFVIANGVGVWTMQYVQSNQSALLNASTSFWMVLLGAFGVRAHRPGLRAVCGLILGFIGTALLLQPAAAGTHGALLPQIIILFGCMGWAVSSIYLRNMPPTLPVLSLIGWQMLLGGVVLAVIGFASGEAPRWHWTWRGILPLLHLVIFASCIAHTAYAWLAQRVSPTSLGTYAYVNPMIATVLGWLVLDEHLRNVQLWGMAVVLTGVLLINWPQRAFRSTDSIRTR